MVPGNRDITVCMWIGTILHEAYEDGLVSMEGLRILMSCLEKLQGLTYDLNVKLPLPYAGLVVLLVKVLLVAGCTEMGMQMAMDRHNAPGMGTVETILWAVVNFLCTGFLVCCFQVLYFFCLVPVSLLTVYQPRGGQADGGRC